MRSVFDALPGALDKIDPSDSYLRSYQALIMHFRGIIAFEVETFVVAAHAVYGWMPTVLELAVDSVSDLSRAAAAVNRARKGFFCDEELDHLLRVVNNSLVGASKLLHFASPDHFAIWDSNVYQFIHGKKPYHYRMNSIQAFSEYHKELDRIRKSEPRFPSLHSQVNERLGYEVLPLRALELVIFHAPSDIERSDH